jgi:hypothetical protein
VIATARAATATVGSDQAQISQLQQQVAAQGLHVHSLVSSYNQMQAHLDDLHIQIVAQQSHLDQIRGSEAAATATLQSAAIDAYMSGDAGSSSLALFSASNDISSAQEQMRYLRAAGSRWTDAFSNLKIEQSQVETTQRSLHAAEAQARATLGQLARARQAALSAIASETATLTDVKGNLQSLLAAAAQQRQAAQQAVEQMLATTPMAPLTPSATTASRDTLATPARTPSQGPSAPTPATPSSGAAVPSSYTNPLRAVAALSASRVDQGVDYSGIGPVYAIGNGTILTTVGGGWPGGTFIAYELTDGPARGLVVYIAEDLAPTVQPGQHVNGNTVLGMAFEGPNGIETGWADGSRLPNTMARDAGQYNGHNSTAFGANFAALLQRLGAPSGFLVSPPAGALPAFWPHW